MSCKYQIDCFRCRPGATLGGVRRTTLASVVGGVLAAGSLQAATITVSSLEDGSVADECTLRDAIRSANANQAFGACAAGSPDDMDRIEFELGLAGTIQLQADANGSPLWDGSHLLIGQSIQIVGPTDANGDSAISVVGTGASPVFHVGFETDRAEFHRLTISGGHAPPSPPYDQGYGGGILSFGRSLLLEDTVIAGNSSASGGGGVWHDPVFDNGELTARNCRFSDNLTSVSRDGSGGAMAVRDSVVTISGCEFSDNQAGSETANGDGGALSIEDAISVDLVDSNFYTNTARGGQGGAVHIEGSESQLFLAGNLLEYNQADLQGGGLSIQDLTVAGQAPSDLAFVNNEIFSNLSGDRGGGLYLAGGLGDLTFNGDAVRANRSEFWGGGVFLRLAGSRLDWQGGWASNNLAERDGGGGLAIAASDGSIQIDRVQVSLNTANDGRGGGMLIMPLYGSTAPASIVIENSLVFGNSAAGGGGVGLQFPNSTGLQVVTTNNEWSGNRAVGADFFGEAGAIFFDGGDKSLLVVSNSTVSGNESAGPGGGIFARGDGDLSVKYSTLAGNQSTGGWPSHLEPWPGMPGAQQHRRG